LSCPLFSEPWDGLSAPSPANHVRSCFLSPYLHTRTFKVVGEGRVFEDDGLHRMLVIISFREAHWSFQFYKSGNPILFCGVGYVLRRILIIERARFRSKGMSRRHCGLCIITAMWCVVCVDKRRGRADVRERRNGRAEDPRRFLPQKEASR
jgi:hypothetical protein